jgi:hypothetical protein
MDHWCSDGKSEAVAIISVSMSLFFPTEAAAWIDGVQSGDQLPELLHGTRKHTHTAGARLRFRASLRGICCGKVGHGTVSFSDFRGQEIAQLAETLGYEPESGGFDFRWRF